MPSVPVTWLNDFVANTNVGSQSDPVITQLASGHILVVWTDSDNSSVPGSPAGTDVIARIFDSQGNPVTGEIRLNTANTADSEFNPTVTALADGGFVIAYDETGGTFDDLNLQTYSFNPTTFAVTPVSSAFLFLDTGTSNPIDPSIASASSTSVLAAYHTLNADGSDSIVVRTYNPSTNAVGAEIVLLSGNTGAGEDASGPDVAALSSGNYAVAFVNQNPSGTPDDLIVHVRNQAGGLVSSATVASLDAGITDPKVAALNNGNFVVAYERSDGSGDISFRVFSNAGTPLTGGGPFAAANGANSQNEPAVTGLADGTFIIAWDDDTTGQLMGQRFSVSGQNVFSVSGQFLIDNTGGTSITEIELAAFEDGRFSVTWNDGGDIRVKIMDTRDLVNGIAVYSPDSQQVGTIGDDVFTADASAAKVFGHTGNDIITEAGSIKEYFGGEGDDTLIVTSIINSDRHDGGFGTDTINWSGSGVSGATFDLGGGTASSGASTETMVGFENLIATNNADIIFGTGGENVIAALDGNDTIEGGFATDTIDAGSGNDSIIVRDGEFADNVTGGTGIDTYEFDYQNQKIVISLAAGTLQVFDSGDVAFGPALTVAGVENVNGGDLEDTITGDGAANILQGGAGNDTISGDIGDDILNGGAGVDILRGGAGNDNYVVDSATDLVDESIAGSGGIDLVRSVVSFNMGNVTQAKGVLENITLLGAADINASGNSIGNILTGNTGDNILNGGGGGDTMRGGAGNDSYFVDNSGDLVDESVAGSGGIDTISSSVTFNLGNAAQAKGILENVMLLGAANINASGNTIANTLTGNTGANILNGGGGGDTMRGLAGNDTYIVDNAGDILDESIAGSNGLDLVRSAVTFNLENIAQARGAIENLELLGAGNVNAIGNALANILTGNTGNNILNGRAGVDTMRGLAGNDTYVVDSAGDIVDESIAGSTGIDTIQSAISLSLADVTKVKGVVENLTLLGTGNINAVGNTVANNLAGNSGNNILIGGGGNDSFIFNTALNSVSNVDTINDMNASGNDTVRLENAIFTTLAVGALSAGAFRIGAAALDADDRIIYNSANGELSYDVNGNTAGGSTVFAILDPGLALTAADFFVI